MIRIKKEYKIGKVLVVTDNVFICHNNGNLYLNKKLIVPNVESQSFWLKDNVVYYHDLEGKHCFYEIISQNNIIGIYGIAWFSIEEGVAVCSYNVEKAENKWHWKTGILDIFNQKIIQEIPLGCDKTLIAISANTYLFSSNQHLILGIKKKQDKFSWTNDISDIGIWRRRDFGVTYREEYAIKRAIAVVNDVLWLDISKGVIMGIDAQTGKTLHVFKEQEAEIIKIEGKNSQTKEYDFYTLPALPEHPHTFYDEVTQKLFGVHKHQYYEVDLQNPKLRIYDLIDEYALFGDIDPFKDGTSIVRLQAWATRSCFDATHIHFIVDNASKAQIASLNRQTLKIDWFYEFDDSGILIQIEVSSNNLYILDNQNTLHIFEKGA